MEHGEVSPPPPNWPSELIYLAQPAHSDKLDKTQLEHLKCNPNPNTSTSLPVVKLPLQQPTHLSIQRIQDPSHPANYGFGLYATQPLPPSSLVIPYLGRVHSNDANDTDTDSNYDLSLDREVGLSIDAWKMGNEARMTNDYRGVPRPMATKPLKKGEKLGPNAEFRDLYFEYEDGRRELGIGIFVLGVGRSGKGKDGIVAGEEVLVNYGKGFWKERSLME